MEARKIIDWLTVSRLDISKFMDYVPDGWTLDKALFPVAFYPLRWSLMPAGTLSVGETDKQGIMLNFTGSDCAYLREIGTNPYDLMLQLGALNFKATRLDYAVDVFEEINVRDCVRHWNYGFVETRVKTEPLVIARENERDYTAYFGSRNSSKFVRIYDKAAEMKMLEQAWIRVELQARKESANAVAQDMEYHGMVKAGDSHIKKLVNFTALGWWQDVLSGATDELTSIPKPIPAWQKWLKTQVMPAIEKRANESEESNEWLRDFAVEMINAIYSANVGITANGISDKEG